MSNMSKRKAQEDLATRGKRHRQATEGSDRYQLMPVTLRIEFGTTKGDMFADFWFENKCLTGETLKSLYMGTFETQHLFKDDQILTYGIIPKSVKTTWCSGKEQDVRVYANKTIFKYKKKDKKVKDDFIVSDSEAEEDSDYEDDSD